ncbi:ROK family protein [Aureibacter tunicatorum]|uniref:Glucokinase n=1 Tax=Aureibacter tunicatorum TaxID=866807 RepID=A0AAE3XLF5_9BACT|nr:ROK family protein [Aureibacter tunicatorum]MDR6238612.1 glucokinase [Aureibacter tunicatorum]BDD05457.1 glucokinase [Aureibacter tunicatorum]
MRKVAIGIDIGGTNSVIGIVDEKGEVLSRGNIPTDKYDDINLYVNELSSAVKDCLKTIEEDIEVNGIGIGAPNGNHYSGTIEYAPNLKFKGVVPLVELLKEKFDYPVITLTNDANAAAIGEMIYGGAKWMKNFIMITLGTGLGSGIVINEEMVYGHDGFAGELGHVIVEKGGRKCGCGRRGCLETYCSATGIVRTIYDLLGDTMEPSVLREQVSSGTLSSKSIYDAAVAGDKLALEAFDFTAEKLGEALANAVAFSSPEAIFLFGGLANAGDMIIKPTKKYMEENLLKIYQNKVDIIKSELPGADAAVLGASSLVWQELRK